MTLEDDMATIGPGGVEAANRKHPMTQAPKIFNRDSKDEIIKWLSEPFSQGTIRDMVREIVRADKSFRNL